jgi:hypothetical protein
MTTLSKTANSAVEVTAAGAGAAGAGVLSVVRACVIPRSSQGAF